MKVKISIAIATYKRPKGLSALLFSLIDAVQRVHTAECSVVVVDNDPDGAGREPSLAMNELLQITYIMEPTPGIDKVRNSGIRASFGSDYVIFLDDDEVVDPNWLAELLHVQEVTKADMVAGPVFSVLPPTAPRYISESGIFERARKVDMAEVAEAGSGNLLCRMYLFESRDEAAWFQSSFGLSGGGDAELTRRFHRDGARIVWAANARVSEPVPASRLNLKWLANRYRRLGSVDYRLSPNSRYKRIKGLLSGVVRITVGFPPLLWTWVRHRELNAPAFRRAWRGVGFVESATFGGYSEYKR